MSSRDRILEIAATCFLEEGFQNTRMTTIAQNAAISRTALYKYFSSKEELLLSLQARVIEEARHKDLPLLQSDAPPLDRLSAWLRNTLQSQWRHHAVRVIQLEETQGVLIDDDNATQDIIDETAKALIKLFRDGINQGEIRRDITPKKAAYLIQGLLMGVLRNNVSTRPMFSICEDTDIEQVVSIMVNGLRAL